MKLYNFSPAANGQRIEMFLLEKNLKINTVELNVREDELFKEPYKSMNPFNCIPFLEIEDGTIISETVSICRYLEELNPKPSLFGKSIKEKAIIDMWNRRIEFDGFFPLIHSLRNKGSFFKGKVIPGTRNDLEQLPDLVKRGNDIFTVLLDRIDPHLLTNKFIAGDDFSIADITGHFMMNISKILKIEIKNNYPNVYRWQLSLENRDSVKIK
jgi:glutathione S-transferase